MRYLSIVEVAEKWNIARGRVQILCNEDRIDSAFKVGNMWVIPNDAIQPEDARVKKEAQNNVNVSIGNIRIDRVWSMPNKNTFAIKPIRDLIIDEMTEGLWVDPFANRNRLAKITNDLNGDFDSYHHLGALDFLKMFDDNGGVLYDPPYSHQQVSECCNNVGLDVTWDTIKASFWAIIRKKYLESLKKVAKLLHSVGIVVASV